MAGIYVEAETHISYNGGLVCCAVATCACCWHGLCSRVAALACRSRAQEQSHNIWMCIMGGDQQGGRSYFTWKDFDLMISQALGDASRLGTQECLCIVNEAPMKYSCPT